MVESIDDRIKFEFKKGSVDDQLKEQNLQDQIGISFKFDNSHSLGNPDKDLKELSISIENKSENIAIYVDWDNSSLVVEHSKQSRRVIRKSPDLTRDLAVPQSPQLHCSQKNTFRNGDSRRCFSNEIKNQESINQIPR